MSWMISLILAGSMFAGDAQLPLSARNGYVETNAKQVVRLDETERFEQTYPLTANGRISVSNVNGPITIEAWDRNEVRLEAVKTAENREYLQDVQIKIDARPDSLRVETDYDALKRRRSGQRQNIGKLEVAYKLQVPRGAILDEIEAVNGSVTVSNMTNVTKISAVNGEIRATNLRGTAVLETVNGTVEADFATLERTSQITLTTVNGRANLVIPSDADATIRADTVNGNIINDFGLPVRRGQYVGRDLYGRVGSGDARIKLNSVNGPLTVRRRQDGKTVKPATNLLSQRNTGDEVSAAVADTTRRATERAVRTAVAQSAKVVIDESVVREAMDEARREIEKSGKELAKVKIDSKEISRQIREAQRVQVEAMSKMRENGWFSAAPSASRKGGTFGVKGTPKVTVDARNCTVVVRGWDKPEVKYSVTRYSRSVNNSPIQYTAETDEREVTIKVNEGNNQMGFPGDANRVRVEVFVPKKSNLRILTNREIRVEGVSGELDLQGGDEAVNVREAGGTLRVSTEDGRIRIVGFDGELVSKTVDGAMNLEGNFQKLSAQTVDGTIVLVLPDDANVNIESNREDIESDGLPMVLTSGAPNLSMWKIGGGGERFRLSSTADGRIFVRGAGQIKRSLQ